MFNRLRNFAGGARNMVLRALGPPDDTITLRRWEAARTDRLNSAHWSKANQLRGQNINQDLAFDLEWLRTRSTYEASNNPMVEGMIRTYMLDVVGQDGPVLQVQGGNESYQEALEQVWAEWWARPDMNGQMSGPDMMRQWVNSLWTAGEFLCQITVDTGADSKIKTRLHNLDARRLQTPYGMAGDYQVTLGVRRTRTGKPLQYFVLDSPENLLSPLQYGKFVPVDASQMIHGYRIDEPGQARGVPWLASVLGTVADLRDCDKQVLAAIRAAANFAVVLYTEHPDIKAISVNESTEIEPNQIVTMPPGWKPQQITPTQPGTQYVDYRKERQAEIGRPVNMPLMMVRLDSREHNFSSARFDGQLYHRGVGGIRTWLDRLGLSRLVSIIARESELLGDLPPAPVDVSYEWTWSPPPEVNPLQTASSEAIEMENGTLTLDEACGRRNKDWKKVVAQRAIEKKALDAAGLPAATASANAVKLAVAMNAQDQQGNAKPNTQNEGAQNAAANN